jgi:hypothetical protein
MDQVFAFFVAAHLIVIGTIVFVFVRRRLKLTLDVLNAGLDVDLKAMAAFAKDRHERIGEYVRANWSGAPEQLPGVLEALLEDLEGDAKRRNLVLDREILKNLLAASLRAHRLGRPKDLRDALRRLA